MGVNSALLENNIGGEVRQFRVQCSSSSLTAFGVAVATDDSVSILQCAEHTLTCFYENRNSISLSQYMWDVVL